MQRRDMSIPAWTVLRAPSVSSAAPSEDELQSRASVDMLDEIAPAPPVLPRSSQQQRQAGAGPSVRRAANGAAAAGGSNLNGRTQPTSAAPRKPSPPPVPPARRPLPSSDEDDEPRPKKKKKRRIIDPEKGYATAGTRVSLGGTLPTDATRPGPSSQASGAGKSAPFAVPDLPRDNRRFRRVTIEGTPSLSTPTRTGPEADKAAGRRSSAIGALASTTPALPQRPASTAESPLQQARRRKSGNTPGASGTAENGQTPTAGPSKQRTPSASSAPPPHEIIEISDDDDKPTPPPPPPASPAKAPTPTPAKKPSIPRRTRHRPARPAPKYKEVDGVIHLTSDEDVPAPKATQSRPSAPSGSRSPRRPSKQPPEQPSKPPSRTSAAPPANSSRPDPQPPETTVTASDDDLPPDPPLPEEVSARAHEPEDVEMGEEDSMDVSMFEEPPMATQVPIVEDELMEADMDFSTPSPPPEPEPSPEPRPELELQSVPEPEPGILSDTQAVSDAPLLTEQPLVSINSLETDTAPNHLREALVQKHSESYPSEPPGVPAEALGQNTLISTTSTFSNEKIPDKDTSPHHSPPPTPPTVPNEDNQERPLTLPPALALAASSADLRSETASPVSQVLDAPLKDLSISDTASSHEPRVEQAPSATQPASTPASPASSKSPSQLRIRSSLFGGKDGFFKDAYRVKQKRREALRASQSPSNASSSGSAKSSKRTTASLSPTTSRISRVDTMPPSSLESGRPDGSLGSAGELVSSGAVEKTSEEVSRVEVVTRASPAARGGSTAGGSGAEATPGSSSMFEDTPEQARARTHSPEPEPSTLSIGVPRAVSLPKDAPAPLSAAQPPAPTLSAPEEETNRAAPPTAAEVPPGRQVPDASTSDPKDAPSLRATPPVEDPPPDLRTLSQVIRQVVAAKAQKEVIDLTFDDSDGEGLPSLSTGASKPPSRSLAPREAQKGTSPSQAPSVSTAAPATPASQPVRTLDLNAIRNIRKLPQTQQQLSSPRPAPLPIPRNLRRVSGSNKPPSSASPIVPPSTPANAVASSSKLDAAPPSTPSPTVGTPQPLEKPMLPRLRDLIRAAMPASAPAPLPQTTARVPSPVAITNAISRSQSPHAPSPPASSGPSGAESGSVSEAEPARSSPAIDPEQRVATPPRSPSPEAMEEEECLSLIYPDSDERTPEVEMAENGLEPEPEPEHEHEPSRVHEPDQAVVIPSTRRTRSQVASGASSAMTRPRRSARLTSTSTSTSSSVEPPERPISRTRRAAPYVRTASDDAVAAQGGPSRSATNPITKAFLDAGFESLSWKDDRRRIAREFAPPTQLASDIPHELHDRINALSLGARLAGNMQVLVFEAEIRANTADDEPGAPPVRVVNEVDDEPTPPLEFYYSNLMWHGEGVPHPDHDSLRGCDCIGPCDPNSKTCACVKRLREVVQWDRGGFIYDKKGKLRATEYPIFECNMNCACSDECMNRVVQHGRQYEIAICKTPNKGWGVFNGPKKVPANSYVGLYAGEYLTDAEGEVRGILYNKFGRTYLFDLDFWYLKANDGSEEKVQYCIDAYHAGNFTRYLNHSCDPNCVIVACYINEGNLEKPLLTIFTCRDVEPYEELCFSYFGAPDDDTNEDAPQEVNSNDGVYVKCQCGAVNCRGAMWK